MKSASLFLLSLAINCIKENKLDAAQIYLEQLVKKDKKNIEGLRLLGIVNAQKKQYSLAYKFFEDALQIAPKNALILSNKANILLELKKYNDAINFYNKSLRLDNLQFETWSNLGNCYFEIRKFDESIECHLKALKINPRYFQGWSNLGNCYFEIRKFDESIECHLKALKINPRYFQGWSNLGYIYKSINRMQEAIDSLQKSISISHEYSEAHENLASIYLEQKKFALGWRHYNYRWGSQNFNTKFIGDTELIWDGKKQNISLCIWGEQGIGDQILFGRLLIEVKKMNINLTLAVNKKLMKIFSRTYPDIVVIDLNDLNDSNINKFDYHIPLGNLSQIFIKDEEYFPLVKFPYIEDDKNLTEKIKLKLNKSESNKKICGLSIRSINNKFHLSKSLDENDAELLLADQYRFINLDHSINYNKQFDRNSSLSKIETLASFDLFEDVNSLLSIISSCDFIITVSNTVAHLSGAIGKKTYLLLPNNIGKFWYWHNNKGRSLWYPSVRIFQQDADGCWERPIVRLINHLESSIAK